MPQVLVLKWFFLMEQHYIGFKAFHARDVVYPQFQRGSLGLELLWHSLAMSSQRGKYGVYQMSLSLAF